MLEAVLKRVPPQNIEAEMSVLGSMMIDRGALDKGMEGLRVEDFYRPTHEDIFDALGALAHDGAPVDLITLQEELRKRGKLEDCGGTEYLMALVDSVPTAANVDYYAKIVSDKAALRRLISVAQEILAEAAIDGQASALDILASAESKILSVARNITSGRQTTEQIVHEVWDMLERASRGELGVPIGLKPLAQQSVVMLPGDLIVIGGRPGTGKTALACQLVDSASFEGWPGALVSLEMSPAQLKMREMACMTGIPTRKMLGGVLDGEDWSVLGGACNSIISQENPMQIIDAVDWDMHRIAACCRRLVAEGVKVIAIDYLQIIKPHNPRQDLREHVTDVSRMCKALARSLTVPILLLSQLSRRVEQRDDRRPTMGDLRESGGIEAEADLIWLLWRKPLDKGERKPLIEQCEIIVPKGRMVGTGLARCGFDGRSFEFVDIPRPDEAGG